MVRVATIKICLAGTAAKARVTVHRWEVHANEAVQSGPLALRRDVS